MKAAKSAVSMAKTNFVVLSTIPFLSTKVRYSQTCLKAPCGPQYRINHTLGQDVYVLGDVIVSLCEGIPWSMCSRILCVLLTDRHSEVGAQHVTYLARLCDGFVSNLHGSAVSSPLSACVSPVLSSTFIWRTLVLSQLPALG